MKDDPTNNNSEGEAVQSMKRKALRSTLLFILVITVVLFTVNHTMTRRPSDHTLFYASSLRTKTRTVSNTGPGLRLTRTRSSTKGVSNEPTLINSPNRLFIPSRSCPLASKNWLLEDTEDDEVVVEEEPATLSTVLIHAIFVRSTGWTLSMFAL